MNSQSAGKTTSGGDAMDLLLDKFSEAAARAGAETTAATTLEAAAAYIRQRAGGSILVPVSTGGGIIQALSAAGAEVITEDLRARAPAAAAGVTGADFAIADTGTVVLESSDEAVRLATTLPERHFILLDPSHIVADGQAAVPRLRQLQKRRPGSFIAWITGPSRTADIERVLTIGVHGPREVHVILLRPTSPT